MLKHLPQIAMEEPLITLSSRVTYAHVPHWYGNTLYPMQMDLLLPKRRSTLEKPAPVLVFLCGGAVQVEDRDVWLPEMVWFAKHGFAVACPDYRTYNDGVFPAQVEDARACVRFLRAHADSLCIDPGRIAIAGESAGANIAMTCGAYNTDRKYDVGDWQEVSGEVQAVVSYYGGGGDRYDRWVPEREKIAAGEAGWSHIEAAMGGSPDFVPENYDAASFIRHLRPETPPMLLLHGSADTTSPVELVYPLYAKMTELGIDADLWIGDGYKHGDDRFYQPECKRMVLEWLREKLDIRG